VLDVAVVVLVVGVETEVDAVFPPKTNDVLVTMPAAVDWL
jgi:hypothetical protein